jgi:toxin ParE1/3/4
MTVWAIDLSREAEVDFTNILVWSAKTFGTRQAEAYKDRLLALFTALSEDPFQIASNARDEIGHGLRTLHMGARRINGRHLILYRVLGTKIQILRILHDAMELSRHLPTDFE